MKLFSVIAKLVDLISLYPIFMVYWVWGNERLAPTLHSLLQPCGKSLVRSQGLRGRKSGTCGGAGRMTNRTLAIFRPSAAEGSGLHLSRRVLADQLLPPRESANSNLQKLATSTSTYLQAVFKKQTGQYPIGF